MGLNIELVIGREYRIRRDIVEDGYIRRYIWRKARMIGIYPNVVLFDLGPYRETLQISQLDAEVREVS